MTDKKIHYVYRTTHVDTGRFYVGIHSTNKLNDGYLGSGTFLQNAIKKHGKEKFKCEHLNFFPTREEAALHERKLVDDQMLADPLCMNLMRGGTAAKFPVGADSRERMSLAKLGKKRGEMPKEQRLNISRAKYKPVMLHGVLYESVHDTRKDYPIRTFQRLIKTDPNCFYVT